MEPFCFNTKCDQTILLGLKVRNTQGLLDGIRRVPDSSIYFHTHRFLQQHHFLSPEPPNDFAYWVSEMIGDAELGEALSSVDIVNFSSIDELRNRFIEVLESHGETHDPVLLSPKGEEFHFMASRLFVLSTGLCAHSLPEFVAHMERVSIASIYYHIFDAKLRLGRGQNDFSAWFTSLGYAGLANEVRRIDPYTYTLEGLRKKMIALGRAYDRH